jgi:hypothetical protein
VAVGAVVEQLLGAEHGGVAPGVAGGLPMAVSELDTRRLAAWWQ